MLVVTVVVYYVKNINSIFISRTLTVTVTVAALTVTDYPVVLDSIFISKAYY